MKHTLLTTIALLLATMPHMAFAQETNLTNSTQVDCGNYRVHANYIGSAGSSPFTIQIADLATDCAVGAQGSWYVTTPTTDGASNAPLAIPSTFMGRHGNNQTSVYNNLPYPTAGITSAWSRFTFSQGSASTGKWAAFINLRFHKEGNETQISGDPTNTGAPAAEIQVWYKKNGSAGPAGARLSGDYLGTYPVYCGTSADGRWPIISYLFEDVQSSAVLLHNVGVSGTSGIVSDALARTCGDQAWATNALWLTSIEGGFQIYDNDGVDLTKSTFWVKPDTNTSTAPGVSRVPTIVQRNATHSVNGQLLPSIHWSAPSKIVYPGPCTNGHFTLTDPDVGTPISGDMIPSSAGGGYSYGNIPVLEPTYHDAATITIACAEGPVDPINVYIDPSGTVSTTQGATLPNAKVTLLRFNAGTGSFEPVPDGDSTMSADNRRNPDFTDIVGGYRWDVQPALYRVRAEKEGCHAPGNPSLSYVESADLPVPPPQKSVDLVLDCGEGGPPVVVEPYVDWGTGYCAHVTVTNTTGAPWDWQVDFSVQGVIYDFWNADYAQFGSSVWAQGVGWNRTLQPGESTHDVGFCANRNGNNVPNPGDLTVRLQKTNDWGTGYCSNVFVTNNTSRNIDWHVLFNVEGTIYDFWNAVYRQSGSQVSAQGVDWNRTLPPGQTTHDVGFCANRPSGGGGGGGGGLQVKVVKTNDWGTGYCSNVIVTNTTTHPMDWVVNFQAPGTIYDFWNAYYTKSGNTVTARGIQWNKTLQPGQSTQSVGFCANL